MLCEEVARRWKGQRGEPLRALQVRFQGLWTRVELRIHGLSAVSKRLSEQWPGQMDRAAATEHSGVRRSTAADPCMREPAHANANTYMVCEETSLRPYPGSTASFDSFLALKAPSNRLPGRVAKRASEAWLRQPPSRNWRPAEVLCRWALVMGPWILLGPVLIGQCIMGVPDEGPCSGRSSSRRVDLLRGARSGERFL